MSAYRWLMIPVWLLAFALLSVWGAFASLIGKLLWWALLIAQQDFDVLKTANVTLKCTSCEDRS